eukprot:m.668233 g.668233  ORF g.668233 m.668233 type:complete len:824 (-) comp58517_c0_seq1:201-2672(-)
MQRFTHATAERRQRAESQQRRHIGHVLLSLAALALFTTAHAAIPKAGEGAGKVFGVGFIATGANMLAEVLTDLHYNVLLRDQRLNAFLYPEREIVHNLTKKYDTVDAVLDLPTSLYFFELLLAYPEAKFILTISGNEEVWLSSFVRQMRQTLQHYGGRLPFRIRALIEACVGNLGSLAQFQEGNLPEKHLKGKWLSKYKAHIAEVIDTIPALRILVVDLMEQKALEKICRFIGAAQGVCAKPSVDYFRNRSPSPAPQPVIAEVPEGYETPFARSASVPAIFCDVRPLGLKPTSKFAYVALVDTISSTDPVKLQYLVGTLIAIESLRSTGTKQDILMLTLNPVSISDLAMLQAVNITVVYVEGIGVDIPERPEPLLGSATPIYRAKARVLQLIEYEAIIFFDWDMLFTENIDHLFHNKVALYGREGGREPLNTGIFVAKTSLQALIDMCDVATTADFDLTRGWLDYGAIPDYAHTYTPAQRPTRITNWTYWGASVEQGLFYYYFDRYLNNATIVVDTAFDEYFVHFAGKQKPLRLLDDFTFLRPAYREPAMTWLRLHAIVIHRVKIGDLRKKPSEAQLNVLLQDDCNVSYPCSLDRSKCVDTEAGHECICREHYFGLPSQDGNHCHTFVEIIPREYNVSFNISRTHAKYATVQNERECVEVCIESTDYKCIIFAFDSVTGKCIIPYSIPRAVISSQSTYSVFVRDSLAKPYQIKRWAESTSVFATALDMRHRVFIYKHVVSAGECRYFCELFAQCRGVIFWKLSDHLCIGLDDLGLDSEPVSCVQLRIALGYGKTQNYPVNLVRALSARDLQQDDDYRTLLSEN